jgi:hypothetical protein
MKRSIIDYLFLAGLFCIFTATTGMSQEAKQERQWYRFEVQTGDSTYQCIGSSPYDEKELAKRLENEEFVLLDDAAYMDANGKIKSWMDWDPKASSRLYLNGRYVILINPLKGDPRKAALKK